MTNEEITSKLQDIYDGKAPADPEEYQKLALSYGGPERAALLQKAVNSVERIYSKASELPDVISSEMDEIESEVDDLKRQLVKLEAKYHRAIEQSKRWQQALSVLFIEAGSEEGEGT